MFHLYKLIQEPWRKDRGEWKYMGEVSSEEIARENVETAAANGHIYFYLAW